MKKDNCGDEFLYSEKAELIGQTIIADIHSAIEQNNAVGSIVGYYDDSFTILSVSEFLLLNLGYTADEFQKFTDGSAYKIFCSGTADFMDKDCFEQVQGLCEGQMLTSEGVPVTVRIFKMDSEDALGKKVWVMSVRVDWEQENMALIIRTIQSGAWYFDCDASGNIIGVYFSNALRKMLGYKSIFDYPNKLESWLECLHPDDKEDVQKRLSEFITDKTGEVKFDIQYRMKLADGSYEWFRDIADATRRKDGSTSRIAGIIMNINKEKQILKKNEIADAFHGAFTKLNLCEYYVDLENNSFESIKVDSLLTPLFQKSHTWDELVNSFIDKYVCEEYKQEVKTFYDRKLIPAALLESNGEILLECCVNIHGEHRWVRNVIVRAGIQLPRYVMIYLRDITAAREERESRVKMQSVNIALEQLVHSMSRMVDHFAICDLKNDHYDYVNMANQSEYASTGMYSDFVDYVVTKYKTLPPLADMKELLSPENLRANLLCDEDIYKFEYCSHDESIYRMATFIPLSWKDGKLERVLWISMDITKAKNNEIEARRALVDAYHAAERANRAKTEFLSNMSHDIRTPMNAIVGMTAIAAANINNRKRVTECLGKITSSSRHLLGLINEVLDMASIESGKLSLVNEDFNLSDLVDNMVTMIKPGIDAHDHELDVHIHELVHENVCGDCMRIQQIFLNLTSNAIKYTPNGGKITITIRELPSKRPSIGCYECSVEDNGIGMTEEFQKIMFEPFVRADNLRTTDVQGTGLGMAITKNIVNMMNGDIRVVSAPNKGTKVTVTIFLKLQDEVTDKIKELQDLPVLVVDDDKACCESTVEMLGDIGIAGEWVLSGREAVARTIERHNEGNDFFAVIVDWRMPEMDGVETARQIRSHVGKDVTIIVLTAYNYYEIEADAREAGVDAFITKPLFRSRLTATFKELVAAKADPESAAAKKDLLPRVPKKNYIGRRVLLVEDNELNREVATEILKMAGIEVDTAENGKQAVDLIAAAPEDRYSLVLMDIQMPVMNGYEATAAIRALNGRRGSLPIVAMTANAFAEDVMKAKNAGMNDHISKPIDLGKLDAILSTYFLSRK